MSINAPSQTGVQEPREPNSGRWIRDARLREGRHFAMGAQRSVDDRHGARCARPLAEEKVKVSWHEIGEMEGITEEAVKSPLRPAVAGTRQIIVDI